MSYFVAPIYMIASVIMLATYYPCKHAAWLFASPILVSALLPPIRSAFLYRSLRPMLEYFDYEQIEETSPQNARQNIANGKNYLLVYQPHGSLSFAGICSWLVCPHEYRQYMSTAVADALLWTPILKHVMGIFGLVSASKSSMKKTLKKPGVAGTVILYVGGMAELFLSCENEEKLYLKKRKGFIKLALQEGVDIVPIYLFGNTTVLSVMKSGLLATISRKLQVSLTYIWGKWNLPIPRPCKLLYVSGQPLGMPHIPHPTQEDIDKWHAKYCSEVARLYESYKEKVPEYKHKKLEIV